MKRTGLACVLLAAATAACSGSDPVPGPGAFDLRAAAGVTELSPVGVTVDPDGNRFFFDQNAGLYALDAAGHATLVIAAAELPQPDEPVQSPFTDVVAVGPGRFALTAVNDGFVLDVAARTLTQHFCYLPDDSPSWLWQRTDALAYDPITDQIWAQPNTYDMENVWQSTQVAAFDRATGADLAWYGMPTGAIEAHGMAILADTRIVLAEGSSLYSYNRFDRLDGAVTLLRDLSDEGVDRIEGLAYDATTGSLLVLDGATDSLYTTPAADL